MKIKNEKLLDSAIATGASESRELTGPKKTFQAYGETSSGAGASTIEVQVRNHADAPWQTVDTLSLTLSTTTSSDYYELDAAWKFTRVNVATISGTGATVSVAIGVQID